MEIVGKKSQGLSVMALKDDKTVIISFNDRSLNFYVTDSLKESLKETINGKIEDGYAFASDPKGSLLPATVV